MTTRCNRKSYPDRTCQDGSNFAQYITKRLKREVTPREGTIVGVDYWTKWFEKCPLPAGFGSTYACRVNWKVPGPKAGALRE